MRLLLNTRTTLLQEMESDREPIKVSSGVTRPEDTMTVGLVWQSKFVTLYKRL
jgi:hypothetical protein